MRYYVYKPNGALVTDVLKTDQLMADAEFCAWPRRVPQPAREGKYALEIYNADSRLPDITGPDRLGRFFTDKLARIFREFCGDENDYFEIVARGPSKTGEVEVAYTGIHSKIELDCMDEDNSVFIAVEYNAPKFKGWRYKDIEILKFIDEKIGGHHHFRLKGWDENSFISEPLAKALRAAKPTNLLLEPIDKYFRVSPYALKEDLWAPRTLSQSSLYGGIGWDEFARTHTYRRRNIDAAFFLQHALPKKFKPA